MLDANRDTEDALLEQVQKARSSGTAVSAILKTDERVFARITDGIYREPASALRELIANAYDADATNVRVDTDAPRFSRITVRDNGHGLTEEALVHVVCHIGGSLKRTQKGSKYNVVREGDPFLSPGGRKLIGKLGIGLFSVSQLTHHLTIVTKVKGEKFRRVCDILLMPQRDMSKDNEQKDEKFITGKVQISTISASDEDSHGTEITLLEIRPYVRESLQSASTWAAIGAEPLLTPEDQINGAALAVELEVDLSEDVEPEEDDFIERPEIPKYHIGRVSSRAPELLAEPPSVPWDVDDSPEVRFEKLVAGVAALDTGSLSKEKIKLSSVLDNYFRTLWTLSLSVPVQYISKHPFTLKGSDGATIFTLSNKPIRPRAEELTLHPEETIGERCGFVTKSFPSATPFEVIVDGVSLRRPISFPKFPKDGPVTKNLLFVGKIKSDMASIPSEYSGGPLELEAYFYWQPRVVPAEHNGIMVRINGASGIIFDDQFLKYQVSEQTRLRQITAEIFMVQGLDAALNIDRESFNVAHPHYQFIRKWVHHSLRQVVSKHKALTKGTKDEKLEGSLLYAIDELNRIASPSAVATHPVAFLEGGGSSLFRDSLAVFDKATVLSPRIGRKVSTKSEKLKERLIEEQIKAVASLLQDYEFFRNLDSALKDEILRKIVAIFSVEIY